MVSATSATTKASSVIACGVSPNRPYSTAAMISNTNIGSASTSRTVLHHRLREAEAITLRPCTTRNAATSAVVRPMAGFAPGVDRVAPSSTNASDGVSSRLMNGRPLETHRRSTARAARVRAPRGALFERQMKIGAAATRHTHPPGHFRASCIRDDAIASRRKHDVQEWPFGAGVEQGLPARVGNADADVCEITAAGRREHHAKTVARGEREKCLSFVFADASRHIQQTVRADCFRKRLRGHGNARRADAKHEAHRTQKVVEAFHLI